MDNARILSRPPSLHPSLIHEHHHPSLIPQPGMVHNYARNYLLRYQPPSQPGSAWMAVGDLNTPRPAPGVPVPASYSVPFLTSASAPPPPHSPVVSICTSSPFFKPAFISLPGLPFIPALSPSASILSRCSCSNLASNSSSSRSMEPSTHSRARREEKEPCDSKKMGNAPRDGEEVWKKSRYRAERTRRNRVPLSAALLITLLATTAVSAAGVTNDLHTGTGVKQEPQFGETISNMTVAAGREAQLSCTVENLGQYKVGWLKVDTQTILSLQKRVVTHNTRISVTHDEHRTWSLHVRQVKEADSGCYMCQINTKIMKNQVGCITVHVPPDFINNQTSSDTTVKEGESVTLGCAAKGYPEPRIKWKREDGRHITLRSSSERGVSKNLDAVPGSNLTLARVTRKQMGAYLCIASNSVPPTVSKRIILYVNFSPVVKVDNQLIGAPLGTDVDIECHVEAFPKAVNYWQRDNGEMLLDGWKYKLKEEVDSYRVTMKLTIRNFSKDDSGQYKCLSTNSLGTAEGSIRVYEIIVPTQRTTTEHQYYHPYPSTPRSRSGGPLDHHRPDGGGPPKIHTNGGLVGAAGGGVGGMGEIGSKSHNDYEFERDQGRQLQRQRQKYEKGSLNGISFGPPMDGSEGQGSGAAPLTLVRIEGRGGWRLRFSCLVFLLVHSGFQLNKAVL